MLVMKRSDNGLVPTSHTVKDAKELKKFTESNQAEEGVEYYAVTLSKGYVAEKKQIKTVTEVSFDE